MAGIINPGGLEQVEINYGKEIEKVAEEFELSAAYLKALCMLESSGRKYIKPRFEEHIYLKLKALKNQEITQFENVTPHMIRDSGDEALRNMAKSWGPFQLMGYKCLYLQIQIADLRGKNAVYWAAKWINETYGDLVRAGEYKHAFHIHNTGKKFPNNGIPFTFHPDYVTNGLKYMEHFKNVNP